MQLLVTSCTGLFLTDSWYSHPMAVAKDGTSVFTASIAPASDVEYYVTVEGSSSGDGKQLSWPAVTSQQAIKKSMIALDLSEIDCLYSRVRRRSRTL